MELIYSKFTIDFAKVAVDYCTWLEAIRKNKKEVFVDQITKILPLLYLKASVIPDIEENFDSELQSFISEDTYESIRSGVADILGEDDTYLETFHPDIQFSDTPVAAYISENLADIYQDLGNFISVFRHGEKETMTDSLSLCINNFKNYWGQKVLNALKALHHLKYGN